MRATFILPALVTLLVACQRERSSDMAKTDTMKSAADTGTLPTQGYANVNGIKMYYEIYGEGKPLVLLHGGGSTIETTFGRIIPALAAHRQVIGVELQAHGHTSDRDADLSFEQDADDVAALLRTLKIGRADFFGFSNGGNTALQIAVRHPAVVNKVVAASVLLRRNGTTPQFWEFMKHANIRHMPQPYQDAFLKINGDSALLQNMHDKCVKRVMALKDLSDEEIRSIQAPVLLVNGDADVATPEHVVEVYRLLSHGALAILPGGHGEYMGEITTLKPGKETRLPILPILEKFMDE